MTTRAPRSNEAATTRVLIVEDDEGMRALLKSLVLDLGYKQVFDVGRPELALERLEYDSFSLAIVDLNLGEQDGASLISAIRSNPRDCVSGMPILVASTAATSHRIHAALLAGADGFLCKPFSVTNLKRQVRFADSKAQARSRRCSRPEMSPTTPPSTGDVVVLD